jgi:hypothetical protein
MDEEFNRLKTDYEQLKLKNHEEINQEIVQLRQTNDVSFRQSIKRLDLFPHIIRKFMQI